MPSRRPSALTVVLGSIFFFATHVFAVSAVLGVDFGTEYFKAALVKPGIPLEIVLTKDSRRKEASAVAFKPSRGGVTAGSYPERAYGSDAIALAARFPADVYPNLKTILGLTTDDDIVKAYAARYPALQLEKHDVLESAAFKSKAFTAEEDAWLVEELLAMQLQSIRKNAEISAGPDTTVRSIVLTVPPFYTIQEKRSIQLAAELAGLKVLSLISDGLAVGLNYATSRQFPNINEGGKPEHHLIFDMGAGSTTAAVLRFQARSVKDVGKFNKTVQEVTVLGAGWDNKLGGDLLNTVIVDDMVKQFIESKGAQKISAQAEGVKAHGRAMAKLTKEAERLRHILSANTNTQSSFEGLYEDVDFKYKISREAFETMSEPVLAGIASSVRTALDKAGLTVDDLDSIILHGGATRTPFVQKTLEDLAGSAEKVRTNVNADEAAVFGAGFRAAELSPSFRVKEIRISEGSMYATGMKWTNVKEKQQQQRLWSPISPIGGVPKEVTFANLEDFEIAFYQQIGETEVETSKLATKNLTETVAALKEKYSCTDSEIQFRVGLKLAADNGEVEAVKAVVECEAEVTESFVDGVKNLFGFGKKDQKPLEGDDKAEDAPEDPESSSSTTSTESSETEASSSSTATDAEASDKPAEEKEAPKKKKEIVSIPVKVAVEKTGSPSLSTTAIKASKARLQAFENSDKARRQREEALNQLEGFTYKVRDLLENEAFVGASTAEERATLEQKASEASDWLYGEGADATKDEFKAKHKELSDIATRVQARVTEAEKRPELVSGLKEALDKSTVFIDQIKDQIKEYNDWHASASASAASASADSSSSTTTTEAASSETPAGDFDGLEDEETVTATADSTKSRTMDDVVKEKGPIPPLYTDEDVDTIESLHVEITTWLVKLESEQAALGPTDEPVLLVKDLEARRAKLDKAGMDLALKGVRNFDKKTKKPTASKKDRKSSKTASAKPAGQTIELGKDGKMPTEAEIEEILKRLKEQDGGELPKHDEL
ncbi:stress protein [Plectosphaerella plurivora]|uniref:Stress protein n=1 Tax=Plectosphaerella plurivora TaxID=936078 RepID=A0A9P9ADL3_9PEZI|nr:stress protein [Plectosphaerella plurivora]